MGQEGGIERHIITPGEGYQTPNDVCASSISPPPHLSLLHYLIRIVRCTFNIAASSLRLLSLPAYQYQISMSAAHICDYSRFAAGSALPYGLYDFVRLLPRLCTFLQAYGIAVFVL